MPLKGIALTQEPREYGGVGGPSALKNGDARRNGRNGWIAAVQLTGRYITESVTRWLTVALNDSRPPDQDCSARNLELLATQF